MCKSTCIHIFSCASPVDSPFVHDISSASPVDSPCVHDISSASPVDPSCLHNVSSPSPVDLPVAVAYAPRYYRRCGIGISIFYLVYVLCVVLIYFICLPCQLHGVLSSSNCSIYFIIFITAWNLRFHSAAYAGCHGNFRSVVLP